VNPAPFIRGCAFDGAPDVPYPRADPLDAARLPGDTWATARLPVGVRLELVGDATGVTLHYRTQTADLGYRGAGAGTTFSLWRGGTQVDEAPAVLGEGEVRLATGGGAGTTGADGRVIVYLPEGMRPEVLDITASGGSIEPAPPQPRWLAYGDSVAEGWSADAPSGAWPAVCGRRLGLDVVNLGYAGSARGEIASAEQIARVPADVLTVSHGTNCWTRTPHSAAMMREGTVAFLQILRQGHPSVPIVVISPVVRPDAETTANRLGATLGDLRAAIEEAATARGDVIVVPGADLLDPTLLAADGVHPSDEGHRVLAEAVGRALSAAMTTGG
jgi:lysophospholipase L1-like esterase